MIGAVTGCQTLEPALEASGAGSVILMSSTAAVETFIYPQAFNAIKASAVCARLLRASFEAAEVAVVEGGPEIAAALLELPFDHIFFTGSTPVGKRVMAAAARHLSAVTLELGGKSPVIIDDDVDLAQAASRIAWGKYMNAGQICLSPDYILVRAAQRDAFVAEVTRCVQASFHTGGALNEADLSQIVNERNLRRLSGLIDDAVGRGARIALGGQVLASRRMAPTILVDVPRDAAIMQEEIFGPIMPVLTYEGLDDAVNFVNGRDKPLALYVFSRREAFVDAVLARTSSGGVTVNDVIAHVAEPKLPFGGVGPSGLGSYHGYYSFIAFSHERSVYGQAAENPMEAFARPPYAGKLEVLTGMIS